MDNKQQKEKGMSNYPSSWDKEKIEIWENDLMLTAQMNGLFCQLSLAGKKRMINILQIELKDLVSEQEIEKLNKAVSLAP